MNKNIIALLNSNLRVIIPDFGAFIIRQKEPKIVVFNEFLRYNDGLLIENLIKTEGIEMEIALQQLSDYTIHAAKMLETGEVFAIEGLGTLQKDNSGKILFTSESEIRTAEMMQDIKEEPVNKLIEKKSMTKPNIKPEGRPKTKSTPKTVSKLKQEEPTPEEVKTSQEVKVPVELNVPVETPPAEVVTVPEALLTITAESKVENSIQEKDQDIATGITGHPAEMYKPTGNKTNQVLRWVTIILLANIAILAWFIFQDNIRGLFKNNKEPARITDSVFQNLSDSVIDAATDTSLIFREAPEISAVEESAQVQGNSRYYIVAGCFRDEVNADELVRSLKIKGFNAEKFGKIGNLYAVCFASYGDKELAVKELKRIREEIHPEAWMTRF
jgi:hypothetical protein